MLLRLTVIRDLRTGACRLSLWDEDWIIAHLRSAEGGTAQMGARPGSPLEPGGQGTDGREHTWDADRVEWPVPAAGVPASRQREGVGTSACAASSDKV